MLSKLLHSFYRPLRTLAVSRQRAVLIPAARLLSTTNFCWGEAGGALPDVKEGAGSASGDESKESEGGEKSSGGRWTGKNAWKLGLISLSFSGVAIFTSLIFIWGPPEMDEEGKEVKDEHSEKSTLTAYIARTGSKCLSFNQTIRDPVSDRLLPDPLQPPYYQPPYTLVVEMKGVLVHPEWTFKTGWRFKKRPALDLFLQSVSPFFEVVCFTQETALSAAPVLHQIDPQGQFLHYRLFREATRYRNGAHIKDLNCLNRPLNRVIVVDWSSSATQLHPRNALRIKKWKGNEDDRDLIDLAAFLRMLAMSGVDDIRSVLEFYSDQEDPLEIFRENQSRLMEEQARKREETQQQTASSPLSRWGNRLNRR